MTGLLLRGVRVGPSLVDVLVRDGAVAEVAPSLAPPGDVEVLDGHGGALLPGLHDHHVHLLATAAARGSVAVGPEEARDREGLASRLRAAAADLGPGGWLRAVGYHESVAGALDRDALDDLVPGRPVRVQHRSGALWVLSSAALDALGPLDDLPAGAERTAEGRLTGRFLRCDDWLRTRLPPTAAPDLTGVGAHLARLGVTGVTDATPYRSLRDLTALAAARADGRLPQRTWVMGGVELAGAAFPPELEAGPVKVVLDEHDPLPFDDLVDGFRRSHAAGRSIAVHCVTRAALALALAAWDEAGAQPGDRVEHGSVVPPELRAQIARLGLTVVTQPAFVSERGDQYLSDVDPDDRPHLYPCRSLLEEGIEVAASSDAPYTDLDPWAAMRAAATRTTRAGQALGLEEAVTPARALALYLGHPARPGGPPRRIEVGAPADLCLLDGPAPTAVADLRAERVRATIIAGRPIP